jgi:hypothetical protein
MASGRPTAADNGIGNAEVMPTVEATIALSYPYTERATAGLRAALRAQLPNGELPDWSTLVVTGPVGPVDVKDVDSGGAHARFVAARRGRSFRRQP